MPPRWCAPVLLTLHVDDHLRACRREVHGGGHVCVVGAAPLSCGVWRRCRCGWCSDRCAALRGSGRADGAAIHGQWSRRRRSDERPRRKHRAVQHNAVQCSTAMRRSKGAQCPAAARGCGCDGAAPRRRRKKKETEGQKQSHATRAPNEQQRGTKGKNSTHRAN